LRRKIWVLALAGSIFTLLNSLILGIFGAIAFLAILSAYMDNPSVTTPISSDPLLNGITVLLTIFPIFGILAIAFVVLGKREFK
jgi:hypothetical protein